MASAYIKAAAGVLGALALVVLPVASASAATSTTQIDATVGSTITVTSSGTALNLGSVAPTGATAEEGTVANDTVTVTTNNATGYALTLQMNTGSTASSLLSGTNQLPGGNVTTANTWGYSEDSGATYSAVPANGSPVTLATTSAPSAALGDARTISYNFSANASQPSGTYTGTVLYTATSN